MNQNFDTCASFHINNGAFFGRFVRLDKVLSDIFTHRAYSPTAAGILAESTALAALLSGIIKYDGLFTFQTKSDGPVGMIVVDVSSDGTIRASANYDEDRINAAKALRKTEALDEATPHFLGNGYLAFTVDQGSGTQIYQGVVDIRGKTLADCAMRYFQQSEQIETHLKLYLQKPAEGQTNWKAAGILLQKLPEKGGKIDNETDIVEAWNEAVIFLDSLRSDEVFNPELSSRDILHRLFHAHDLQTEIIRHYKFGCRCSRDKLQNILQAMKPEEIDSLAEKGKIVAECSFCRQKYSFEKGELLKQ